MEENRAREENRRSVLERRIINGKAPVDYRLKEKHESSMELFGFIGLLL